MKMERLVSSETSALKAQTRGDYPKKHNTAFNTRRKFELKISCYSCPILIKLVFSRQIFENSSNTKFCENPSSWNRAVPCGLMDRDRHGKNYSRFSHFFELAKFGWKGRWNILGYHSGILLHGMRKTTGNSRHGNARSKALFCIYCFIVCLLSSWCAYKGGKKNQNSTKTAWRHVAVYLYFHFYTSIQSIATDVDTVHSNKHHYIHEWSVSLQEGMTSSISDICVTTYRISVFDISYEKQNVLSQRHYWTSGLPL